jgi:hypothetical protein
MKLRPLSRLRGRVGVGVPPRVILFVWTALRKADYAFGSNPPYELCNTDIDPDIVNIL